MSRFLTGSLAAALLVTPALAHDFWLQPLRFTLPAPAPVPLLIYVGHGAQRDRWGLTADRVLLFSRIGPDGIIDLKPQLTLGAPQYDATITFGQPGAYVVAFQSSPSVSDLPFLRFNDYIVEEGITPIADHRKRARTERANGREAYSRRAKAIVQIGPVTNADVSRVTRPVGLSLEIIPERHPALLKPGQRLPIQVRFNRQPLSGALVKLTDLNADAKPRATARTDAQGRVSFTIPQAGKWQFNVIWSEPIPGSQTADYRTTFSSLTFGE